MKHYFNLKKSRLLLLTTVLALFGGTATVNAQVTDDFTSYSATSSGQTLGDNWYVYPGDDGSYGRFGSDYTYKHNEYDGADYNYVSGYSSNYNKNVWLVLKKKVSGDITFRSKMSKNTGTIYVTNKVTESDGDYPFVVDKTDAKSYSISTTTSSNTYNAGESETYVAFCIASDNLRLLDVTYTEYVQVEGASLTVTDGSTKLTSPYAYDFGLAVAGTEKVFTLTNGGTEEANVSVATTGGFGATLSSTTLDAGASETLTVTMADATAEGTVTISSTTEGIDDFVINVSGTVRDAAKVYETLGTGSLPEDWTQTSWSFTTGYAYTNVWYQSSNARLVTPKLTVKEGEKFLFEAMGTYPSDASYQTLVVEYSADGTTWTPSETTITLTSDFTFYEVSDIPAGNYFIAIHASQARVRNFYGGELPKVAKMVVTQPASLNYGIISESTGKTFTIANTGTAELTGIEVASTNDVFTITGAPTSLAAGESAEVTVTMAANAVGVFSSDITVNATDMEEVKFTVNGVVMADDVFVIDFEDNALPLGWGNNASNKWQFADGKAYATSAAELTSPKLQFAEGDFFVINATSYDDYDSNYIEITGSVDGTDFTAFETKKFVSRSQIPYGSYAPVVVTDIPTTVKYIKIKGYYVRIEEIAGLTYDQNAPELTVSPTTDAAFGKVKAQPEAITYTITNTGTGTLEGTIASSDATQFTVSESEFSLGKGESVTFDIDLVFDENYGDKAATITIHPTNDGLADVTINATATTKDPNVWEEDFEDGIPETWTNSNFSTSAYGHSGEAYVANAAGVLVTPRLQATEGATIQFDVISPWGDQLLVEWANTRDGEWTEIGKYTEAGTQTFTAPADGYYYIRFSGSYVGIDNIIGFKEAPLPHDAVVSAKNIPATGTVYQSYTATVTVTEKAGKEETLTAKFFIGETQYGEDVVETVAANGTKTFTVTFTPDEAVSGDAYFTVTNGDLSLETEKQAVEIAAAASYTFADTEDNSFNAWDYTNCDITISRNYVVGWNTIALPFDVADLTVFGAGAKAYAFNGVDAEGALVFYAVDALEQGNPYLLYVPTAKTDAITFKNVTIGQDGAMAASRANGAGTSFNATYGPLTDIAGRYGVTPEGKISKAGASASIKGFRGIFTVTIEEGSSKPNPGIIDSEQASALNLFIDGETTGIKAVTIDAQNDKVYNLSGQRVSSVKKGLYIVNGKRVIVK